MVAGEKRYRISVPFKGLTYVAYFAFYLCMMVKCYFNRHVGERRLILDMAWSALILLLFATPWYQPWYAAIFFSFIAILTIFPADNESVRFSVTGLVFCFCSTSYYLLAVPNRICLAAVSAITVIPTSIALIFGLRILRRWNLPYRAG